MNLFYQRVITAADTLPNILYRHQLWLLVTTITLGLDKVIKAVTLLAKIKIGINKIPVSYALTFSLHCQMTG